MESTGAVSRAPRDSLRMVTGSKPSSSSRVAKPPKVIINSSRVGKETRQLPSSSKRRKKAKGLGAVHPSVRLAEELTIRAEQVEELRAKELLYSWEGSDVAQHHPCCTRLSRGPQATQRSTAWPFRVDAAAKSGVGRGSLPPAMERRLSRRPWEWSTKDCEDVLADVIGAYLPSAIGNVGLTPPDSDRDGVDVDQPHPAAGAADPTGETADCTSAIHPTQAPTGGGSPSSSTTGGGTVVMPSENGHHVGGTREDSRQLVGSKSAEHVQPLGNRRLTCGRKTNVDVRCGAASELRRDRDSRTSKRKGSPRETEHELLSGTERRGQRPRLAAPPEVQATVTSDAILREDERKARELTAELNRNHPRRRRVSGGEAPVPVENGITLPPRGDERAEPSSNLASLGSRTGDVVALPAREDAGKRESDGNEDDDGDDGDDDDEEGEEEQGAWPLVVGASAEVWWDDAWYRCTMSSVSTGDQRGVLEFLPYRRKGRTWGREYSTELDLGDWMRAGHLARPGTHLQWD